MDLFFEVQRRKTHIFCDAKESSTVLELKKVIEGILKMPVSQQTLKKPVDEALKAWEVLDDGKSLAECGFSTQNAKAQHPALIALCHLAPDGRPEEVHIDALSTPPPLPDVMRAQDSGGGQGGDNNIN